MNSPLVEQTLDEIDFSRNTLKFLSTDFDSDHEPAPDDVRTSTVSAPVRPLYSNRQSMSPGISPQSKSVASWPLCSEEDVAYFVYAVESSQRRPSHGIVPPPRNPARNSVASSRRRQSSSAGSTSSFAPNPFPAPAKPLPALPPPTRSSRRLSQQLSISERGSFAECDRFSQYSGTTTTEPSRSSVLSINPYSPTLDITERPLTACTSPEGGSPQTTSPKSSLPESPVLDATSPDAEPQTADGLRNQVALQVTHRQQFRVEKRKGNSIIYIDASASGPTFATKHGKNLLRFWSIGSGLLTGAVKFSAYIDAHPRSRDYLVRSHAILSERDRLVAISTRFGRTVEMWDWAKNKKLQQISDVDRWASGRYDSFEHGWSPFAAYRGDTSTIDLYAAMRRDKKPFAKVRTIDLKKAHLPTTMQFPELALSPTSPLLVAASGPRTPRAGRPPAFRETLLVAWEIDDYREVSNEPYRVLKPWDHRELNNASPFSLYTYGSLAVSIWIPASQRSEARGSTMTGSVDFKLVPVDVAFRYVLVWDMSKDSTRLYPIPNTTSCISPDCRFVAYCHIADRLSKLAVLDATTGEEVWCVGGEGNLKSIEQFGDLSQVTDLAFSPDGRLLFLGDAEGTTRVCDVGEVN
ncbi:unnamed protein product [Clonostachys solani]|uniref:Uncharacterized protein n=1 Tax=Clonostachys solani TaxID=160281 RepID=A0A9N9YUK0_9HYPO|nr:unnamed protein product [Clonostachys solani]